MKEQLRKYEEICKRCGECCGAGDDPCINLRKYSENRYYCGIYENRLGPQRTIEGNIFNCVAIKEMIIRGSLRPDCAYNVAGPNL